MAENSNFDLNINTSEIKNHEEYLKLWNKLGKIEIKCIQTNIDCKYKVGDIFYYENPYKKPIICQALLHVIDLYTWRVTLGFPSWNPDDHNIFKIHCPDSIGTIWEIKKI